MVNQCGSDRTNHRPTNPLIHRAHLLAGAGDEVLGVAKEALMLVCEDRDGEDQQRVDLWGVGDGPA